MSLEITNEQVIGGADKNDLPKPILVNDYGMMTTSDGHLEVALGLIPGTAQFDKFGTNPDIGTATAPEDVWNGGGIYTGFGTEVETLEIFSDSILDNGVTPNTGARTVTISGLLDGDYNQMPDITVTLNGTTPVSLGAQTYLRANRMQIRTAGSGGANAGILTLRHTTTTTNVFAKMPIGQNQTAIMAFTVPLGKKILILKGSITMARVGGTPGSAEATVRHRPFGEVFHAVRDVTITDSQNYTFENNGYMVFDQKEDVKVTVENVSDNGTFVSAEADGYIIDWTY